ncbi:MAG: metallophosphoesterase family protein [Trueperaceae bacterium]
MRLLVISDVHADAGSLERVLAHAERHGWDEAVFLGDAVGYGGEASAALSRLRSLPYRAALKGNHEAMLGELRRGRRPNAGKAIVETLAQHLEQLNAEDLGFLDSLQTVYLEDGWGAVHGALRTPFEYLISVPTVRSNASHMKRDVYFVGHTHVPAAYLQEPGGEWRVRPFTGAAGSVKVPPGGRAFLNPGAVSLPRDGVPGSSYGIYDEDGRELAIYRVS